MKQDDLFGRAMHDYWTGLGLQKLRVRTQAVKWEDLPVHHFFRTWEDFPEVEREAIVHCKGDVLDMGAGAGAHALELQARGHKVVAVDNSEGAVDVMKSRGVINAQLANWEDYPASQFDTVLLLMNGIGLAGTIEGLKAFTDQWEKWLKPGGQVIFESTDIAYVYSFPSVGDPRELVPYYGEQTYVMKYGTTEVSFPWLFADKITLQEELTKLGWSVEVLVEDGGGSFLVRSTKL
ncbi:MAG: class I SAM-dependent methyltransferase [Flavobacteriia bacterium]|nr:class I SAM-dependent methyltransferase [Flavobacteriia bacterium]